MAEIKDMLIETPIDKLIIIVKEREKIPLSQAAKELGVEEWQVEEWVKVLEERDFVELIYPAIGEPVIILKKVTDSSMNKKERLLEKQKDSIDKKAGKLEGKINGAEKNIEDANKSVARLEKDLREKLGKVEDSIKMLDSMEKKKQEIINDARDINKTSNDAIENLQKAKQTVDMIDKKIDDKIGVIESRGNQIKDLESMRNEVKSEIDNLDAEIKLTKMMFKGVKSPMLGSLRSLFQRHEKKVDKIKERHNETHKKISDIKVKNQKHKTVISKKSEELENSEELGD